MSEAIRKNPSLWAYLVPIFVILVAIFGLVWIHTQCAAIKVSIHRIKSGNAELEAQNRKLEIERARLKSPGRLRRLGEAELGLERPSTEKILIIDLQGLETTGGNHEKTQ